jgi:hypothetical protein
VKRGLALALAAIGMAAALPAAAQARILQAEDVLPPGQSGYVSLAGTASGTGSPHLTDQTSLFTSFGIETLDRSVEVTAVVGGHESLGLVDVRPGHPQTAPEDTNRRISRPSSAGWSSGTRV